uniref:hypothetical protein n=1 Tax=Microbispora siamensis TaxID=564413 RepID=UPI003571123A
MTTMTLAGRIRRMRARMAELLTPDRLVSVLVRFGDTQAEMALEAGVPLLESRDEGTLGRILVLADWIDYKCGRFREALFHYQRAIAILQRSGSRGALAMALRCAAQLHLELGELDLAEQAVERGPEVGARRGTLVGGRPQLTERE